MAATLYIGRFQPVTKAHAALLKLAKGTLVVAIVKGIKSSLDKDKNPFDFAIQKEMITAVAPHAKVIEVNNAYIPDIITAVKNEYGIEIKEILCGKDREEGYKKFLPKMPGVELKVVDRTEDDISATKVRAALSKDDKQTFTSLVPPQIASKFVELRNIINSHKL